MGVDITFEDNSENVLSALGPAIERGGRAIGMSAVSHAKDIITKWDRVDTGRMRNSITYGLLGNDIYIGTNVEYAPYNELGTVHMYGIHFLKSAAGNYRFEYRVLMEESLENA